MIIISTFYYLLIFTYFQETCLWIVIAGVKTDKEQFPDLQQIFKGFHIPEMKLPLRLIKLIFDCIFNIVHVPETAEKSLIK